MNYYERHIGDYLKDTSHLSLLEHGVYTRLLDVYYTREAPLPADQVARLIGARSKDEREAMAAVLGEFFTLVDGAYTQGRCDIEIARLQDKRAKASASANARWAGRQPQSERNADASPNAMRTHSEGNARAPVPRHQTPDTTLVPKVQGGRSGDAVPSPSRGIRLPADWAPGPEHDAFAEGLGFRNGTVVAELEKFRDYWTSQPGEKGRKADWIATWRNWLRRASEDRGQRPGAGSPDFLDGVR